MCRQKKSFDTWTTEEWYTALGKDGKCLADLILKYHSYYSQQDTKYRIIVRILKITVLLLAMTSTIVLGLTTVIETNHQLITGLIMSALITFITAVSSYFNFEEYWMRNISIHIHLNIMRDNFILDAESQKIDSKKIEEYMQELNAIQKNNINYWKRAIKRV